ncbi:MAG TPA: hypothetical protein VNS46_03490 [Nocardioides sp.]|nr:hypothetical protein [Nocardioides sp.]
MSGGDDDARGAAARAAWPSWAGGPCPPWCVREHGEDDHPEDRYHQSEPSILSVVAGTGDTVPVTASLRSLTLAVRTGRYAGEELAWLVVEALEGPQPRLLLTADAARALARGLHEQLAVLADDG